MATQLSAEAHEKLSTQKVIWFSSVRPDGRPHLVPIWFVWLAEKLYVGTGPKSVKARNIRRNPQVVLALEDGIHPIICEGQAAILAQPLPADLLQAFLQKYEWDLTQEDQYGLVIEVTPQKWMAW